MKCCNMKEFFFPPPSPILIVQLAFNDIPRIGYLSAFNPSPKILLTDYCSIKKHVFLVVTSDLGIEKLEIIQHFFR